jgi:hypothetical protein
MDALKLAFDTLIVGALALPWLAVLLRMYVAPEITGYRGAHGASRCIAGTH